MRLAITSYQLGLAGLTLLAACAPGDRSTTLNEPVTVPTLSLPSAAAVAGTVLLQEPFEDNAFASRGWYDNTSVATTTAQHTAGSTRALEAHFLPGATTPTWGGAARHLFPATPTLYVSYWVKYSSNWVGSAHAYHPHEFLILSDQDGDWDGPSNNWLTAYIEHNYQNGGIPRVALQDNKAINTSFGALPFNLIATTENRSTSGCNGVAESNVVATCFNMPPWYNDKEFSAPQVWFQPSPGAGYKGDWNHVEVYLQLNSVVGGIGRTDGVLQYWFNGALVMDRHDVLYRTGARPTIQFHQFLIAPYIGDGSPVDQTMWVDDLTLGTGSSAGAATNPGTVTGLSVAAVTSASVTLSFTEVNDGTGQPANYDVRWAVGPLTWASASSVTQGTCAVPMVGTAIGAVRTCTVLGLTPATAYRFKLVAFRGTLNVDAVFGAISNVAMATTGAAAVVPVASVTLSPANASLSVGATQQVTATLKDASGNVLTGRTVTWGSSSAAVATVGSNGLATGVLAGTATITATSEGKSGTAIVTVTATATKPGTVTNVAVGGVSTNSVTLSFTEANDGTGQPAKYDVRFSVGTFSWGSATEVTQGTCQTPMAGTAIGAVRSCTVLGLSPSTAYRFQLIAFRGTLNVNAVFGALSNVASGTTAAGAAAPVASVTLSPASGSISVGATQQVTATLKDVAGNTLTGRTVTWASSAPLVATTSGSGLVTGLLPGSATVTATSEGKNGSAAMTVTVLPPPPPPPSGTWPNEPAGLTVRTDWGMDQVLPSGYPLDVLIPSSSWHVVYEQSPGTAHGYAKLVTDPSAPFSPSGVYDFVYPQGMVEGNAPATVYYANLGASELYAGFWWKPSAPFDFGPNGNKIAFMFNGGGGGGGQQFMILLPDGRLHVLPEYPGDYRWRDPNVNATTVTLGVWHRVEWYSNVATGTLKYWLDGVLQGSYTDVRNSFTFDMFQFSPTWGGNVGAQKHETDHYWFDHVHLSVR